MFPLILISIVANHLTYPYTASDESLCTEPDNDAESFLQLMEATTLWNKTTMNFNTRFLDGRNKFRHRLEVEHCWPDDMNSISNAQQNEERATQKRRQQQRFINCSSRGLKPRYSQLEAEKLREHPDATWSDLSTNNIQDDVMLQVCSNFLHDVGQIKIELRSMRQELGNLRVELQEHRPNAMKGNYRPWFPTKRRNKNLPGSVPTVIKTDTLQSGVVKKYETKKSEKYKMKCPPKVTMFLTRTMALMLSTAVPNTIKT